MAKIQEWLAFLGRLLIGLSFLVTGLSQMTNWEHALAALRHTPLEASIGQQMLPVFLTFCVLIEVAGGLCVIIGAKTRAAAFFLSLVVLASLAFLHQFWTLTGDAMVTEFENFVCEIMILGALLLLLAFGPGKIGIDK